MYININLAVEISCVLLKIFYVYGRINQVSDSVITVKN